MPDVVYAVHTRTCTYLLDEEGVCLWIISPTGMLPADIRQCVNAQFVACVDVHSPGGLVGELRIGAAALFVRDSPDGRLVLLRTGAIGNVEIRGQEPSPMKPSVHQPEPLAAPPRRRAITEDSIELDESDLIAYDAEATVTLTMPLYRPDEPPPRGKPGKRRR